MNPPNTVDTSGDGRGHFKAFIRDEESRKIVEQVIADLVIPHATVRRGGVNEAVYELGSQRSPRILLVDITDADLPLSAVNDLAEVCEPGVAVIAVGDRNDVGLFRELINHGVSDYLVKPLTPSLLQRSLLGVMDSKSQGRQTNRLGRMVAVVGTRGGVGTTLVATNVAWSIAHRRRRRVALVDLDLQFGTAALALDLEPSRGLREALERPDRVDGLFVDRAMTRESDTFYVFSGEEMFNSKVVIDSNALDAIVNVLRARFHFVIFDLPRVLDHYTYRILQLATNTVLVTDLSLAGMRDTLRFTTFLPSLNASSQMAVCANRVGEHRAAGIRQVEFEAALGRPIDVMLPYDAKTVALATNMGRPLAKDSCKIAGRLHDLADRLCGGQRMKKSGIISLLGWKYS